MARGGTNTYQIMPSWFVPPAGRPATDTTRNITKALSLQPDAIIINMPSNDVAGNIALNEQLYNYRVMVAAADSLGIPVWVCTTQPRNFSSAAKRGLQVAARDSILATYGSKAIDFWTGFASSTDSILPLYDSGDGVHLNDAAHAILMARVAGEALPNVLADTAASENLAALVLYDLPYNLCGDTATTVQVIVGNLGGAALLTNFLEIAILDQTTNNSNTLAQAIPTLPTCALDTLSFSINTTVGVDYLLKAYIFGSLSPNANDTTNALRLYTIGRPSLQDNDVLQCRGDSSELQTQGSSAVDRVYWYDQINSNQPIYTGSSLPIPPLNNDRNFYAQIARGPFYFFEHLYTSPNSNINWNGVAFDLVATTDTLYIDSLTTKLATLGLQTVKAYYRRGSHVGVADSAAAWTVWDSTAVQVAVAEDFYTLNLNELMIAAGDTVGVYLHLKAANARLGYHGTGRTSVYSDGQLKIIGGSGVSHTFGALFTPRNWVGAVHYHFGSNPLGVCRSSRLPVLVELSTPVDLEPDTTLVYGQSITLTPIGNYTSYQWSDGSTGASVTVDSSWAPVNLAAVQVTVTDVEGCVSSDTIQLTFSNFTTLVNQELHSIRLQPNPSTGRIWLKGERDFEQVIEVVNAQGVVVWRGNRAAQQTLELEQLPKGYYWLVYWEGQQRRSVGILLR